MEATKVTLKLLVDQTGKKVLFAEDGKDFLDFLFSIFALPIGTVVGLISAKKMVGCLGNLYESVENLDYSYMQRNQSKDTLLKKPTSPIFGSQQPLLLIPNTELSRDLYKCARYRKRTNCRIYVAEDPTSVCPSCRHAMNVKANYVASPSSRPSSIIGGDDEGYVKGLVPYVIMDDLVVEPMSTVSSITTLLNHFCIRTWGLFKRMWLSWALKRKESIR